MDISVYPKRNTQPVPQNSPQNIPDKRTPFYSADVQYQNTRADRWPIHHWYHTSSHHRRL